MRIMSDDAAKYLITGEPADPDTEWVPLIYISQEHWDRITGDNAMMVGLLKRIAGPEEEVTRQNLARIALAKRSDWCAHGE